MKILLSVLFLCLGAMIFLGACGNKTRESVSLDQDINIPTLKMIAPYEAPEMRKAIREIVRDYELDKGNINLEVEFIPLENYCKELCLRMESKELADVIISEDSIMPALIDMGILYDISDYIMDTGKIQNYNLHYWNNTRGNGKIYGIPFMNDPYVMFYNKKIFAENHQKAPETWEEFLEVAQEVSNKPYGTYAFGMGTRQTEETTNVFLQLLYSTGGSLRTINGANGIKLFKLLETLRDKQLIPQDSINWNELDTTEAFSQGEIAMMFNRISAAMILQTKSIGFDVGIEPVPYESKETYLYYGNLVGITTEAPYDLAIDFIEYLSRGETVEKLSSLTGTIPVRIDVTYHEEQQKYPLPADYIENQSEYEMQKGSFRLWFNISDAISEGVRKVLTSNTVDIKEIGDEMQDIVRTAIIEN